MQVRFTGPVFVSGGWFLHHTTDFHTDVLCRLSLDGNPVDGARTDKRPVGVQVAHRHPDIGGQACVTRAAHRAEKADTNGDGVACGDGPNRIAADQLQFGRAGQLCQSLLLLLDRGKRGLRFPELPLNILKLLLLPPQLCTQILLREKREHDQKWYVHKVIDAPNGATVHRRGRE